MSTDDTFFDDDHNSEIFHRMLTSSLLPNFPAYEEKRAAEKAGLELYDGSDGLLKPAVLPEGWWANQTGPTTGVLIDEYSRIRTNILFRAAKKDVGLAYPLLSSTDNLTSPMWAFTSVQILHNLRYKRHYSSEGRLTMCRRFTVERYHPPHGKWYAWDNATGIVLCEFSDDQCDNAEVEAWLNEHYPQWQDPGLYWDGEGPSSPRWKFWQR